MSSPAMHDASGSIYHSASHTVLRFSTTWMPGLLQPSRGRGTLSTMTLPSMLEVVSICTIAQLDDPGYLSQYGSGTLHQTLRSTWWRWTCTYDCDRATAAVPSDSRERLMAPVVAHDYLSEPIMASVIQRWSGVTWTRQIRVAQSSKPRRLSNLAGAPPRP